MIGIINQRANRWFPLLIKKKENIKMCSELMSICKGVQFTLTQHEIHVCPSCFSTLASLSKPKPSPFPLEGFKILIAVLYLLNFLASLERAVHAETLYKRVNTDQFE